MAPPSASRINARAAKDKAFLARALKNPGLRAKLDPKYLSSAQRQSRTLNQRLNAPIAQGSSITERDLAHQAQAAQAVRYGPQEAALNQQVGQAQQTERDTGSFYDQYLADLRQHAANIAAFQQGAQQGMAQAAQGITGLGQQQAAQLQQQADAGAAQQGVVQAGQVGDLANAALATRQSLVAGFQGQQASQGATANTYADALANVVAPGQKLTALSQAAGRTRDVRQKVTDLKAEEGAFNQQFRDTRRQDEFKNVLAAQTLNLNTSKAQVDAAATKTRLDQSSPEGVAATSSARASATQAAKYGYTAHQWAMLGPTARNKIISAAKKTSSSGSDTVYTSGPFAGRKKSEISSLSDAERQRIVSDYNAGKGKGKGKAVEQSTQYRREFRRKYGIDPLGTPAHNSATKAISQAQNWIQQVRASNPKMPLAQIGQLLSRGQPKSKDSTAIPKQDPLMVRVAMDIAQYGGIQPGTANRLHHAGYSVSALRLKNAKPSNAAVRRRTQQQTAHAQPLSPNPPRR